MHFVQNQQPPGRQLQPLQQMIDDVLKPNIYSDIYVYLVNTNRFDVMLDVDTITIRQMIIDEIIRMLNLNGYQELVMKCLKY